MLNHEIPVFTTLRRGRHEINKITFRKIFSLKICFRAFRLQRRIRQLAEKTCGKNIYIKGETKNE